MSSTEVLIAFAKLTDAEKKFAVTESVETSRQYSQHVSSLSSQLAQSRKEANSHEFSARGKQLQIDALNRRINEQAETISSKVKQIEALSKHNVGLGEICEERSDRIKELESFIRGDVDFKPLQKTRALPPKPLSPPMPGYEHYFSETLWQWEQRPEKPATPNARCMPIVLDDITLICGTDNNESTQRFAGRLARNNLLRTRAVNVYREFIAQGFNPSFVRKLVKAMYQ